MALFCGAVKPLEDGMQLVGTGELLELILIPNPHFVMSYGVNAALPVLVITDGILWNWEFNISFLGLFCQGFSHSDTKGTELGLNTSG